ncbi:MAG: hypothetical protein M0Z91_02965 [Actinomycetota bacterium]|jgi:hypothetical protein|nr:hypothetical protein [Actinomycetota bacterium]
MGIYALIWTLAQIERAGDRLAEYLGPKESERGEGVVSAAIAVLIFAFLGVVLWVAFKATMGTATSAINDQVAKLGQ